MPPQNAAAAVANKWGMKLAKLYAGDVSDGVLTVPAYFRIGEGGWVDTGSGLAPLAPSKLLTDITAGVAPYTANTTSYFFQKALVGGDLTYTAPNRLEVRCTVNTGEANSDNASNPPQFFELGVFDSSDKLLVYSTFPVEIKTDSRTLQHIVYVDFPQGS